MLKKVTKNRTCSADDECRSACEIFMNISKKCMSNYRLILYHILIICIILSAFPPPAQAACNAPPEYTLGVSVVDSPDFVCAGRKGIWKIKVTGHAEASWPATVELTGAATGFGSVDSDGGTVEIEATASSTESLVGNDKIVTITARIAADDFNGPCKTTTTDHFTIFSVKIAKFDRMPPRKSKSVTITVSPSPLPSGVSVILSWTVKKGTAVGDIDLSTYSITKTTDVLITAGELQSTSSNPKLRLDNVALMAKVNGDMCASEVFTVCAHPTNFRTVVDGVDKGNGMLYFKYVWDSDSGNINDLDLLEVGEIIKFPGENFIPPAPFLSWGPFWTYDLWVNGAKGFMEDRHTRHGNFMMQLVKGDYPAYQEYGFRCHRCLKYDWSLKTETKIDHVVEKIDEKWRYRVTKDGKSAKLDLPLPE